MILVQTVACKEKKLYQFFIKFFDIINSIQCFKYSKFGHIAKDYKSHTIVCPTCAAEHKYQECLKTKTKIAIESKLNTPQHRMLDCSLDHIDI